MARAWYLKPTFADRYEQNRDESLPLLTDEQVYLETEVILGHIDLANMDEEAQLTQARTVRDMKDHMTPEMSIQEDGEAEFEKKCDKIFKPHVHVGEALRVVIRGSCYADIMDLNGRYIRIHLQLGDYWILPGGCCHRATADVLKDMKAIMMHYDTKTATYIFWPEADKLPEHRHYIERMKCLRRSLNFPYVSLPNTVDSTEPKRLGA
ncbi:hypothetical protein BV898_05056 [Hypsibius exemplaris]|uniref:acireductone dioxygenase (Fe(2+)-requiring) n=1 Tax=Hypsibius exemplaris TaxID=2072580 RepID=A0A1W0X114_HYPEX|nr:hypothetical protein BV898_05056 [Hypsibius exemplaris]